MKTQSLIYAGIGSRETPCWVLTTMQQLGKSLALEGWRLRTGNCTGADQAFAKGANEVNPKLVELYLPWYNYEVGSIAIGNAVCTSSCEAYGIAAEHHPAWHKCSEATQAMHARNVHIVLGAKLNKPVQQVICWTPGGKAVGGTAMGMRVARAWRIAVRNLALPSSLAEAYEMLGKRANWQKCDSQIEFGW
jgi:hypothetical protein